MSVSTCERCDYGKCERDETGGCLLYNDGWFAGRLLAHGYHCVLGPVGTGNCPMGKRCWRFGGYYLYTEKKNKGCKTGEDVSHWVLIQPMRE